MQFCFIYQKCQLVTIKSTKGPGATVSKMLSSNVQGCDPQ